MWGAAHPKGFPEGSWFGGLKALASFESSELLTDDYVIDGDKNPSFSRESCKNSLVGYGSLRLTGFD